MIVFLCISWLTALNRQDEMTYDQMVQLFEQQKVESFQFTDSSTLVMQLHDGSTARCRIHDYTLFYNDLNDLVKEQKAAGHPDLLQLSPAGWNGLAGDHSALRGNGGGVRRHVVHDECPGAGRHGAGPAWQNSAPHKSER